MAYEDLRSYSQPFSKSIYWVNDVPPKAIVDKDGKLIGYQAGQGHYVTTDNVSAKILRNRQVRQSFNTVGFKSKNRPVPLPHNSFTYDKTERRLAVGYQHAYTIPTSSITTWPGNSGFSDTQLIYSEQLPSYPGAVDPSFDWFQQLNAKATLQVRNSLKDQSLNAAQALAERRQTADLLANTATRVAKAITSLRRGDMIGAARGLGVVPPKRAKRRFNKSYAKGQADAVGNAWLELQYGWKPLLSDVYGAAEHLAKSNNNRLFGRAHGRGQRQETVTVNTNRSTGSYQGINRTVSVGLAKASVRYSISYEVTSPTEQNLSKLGITNPILLAWELLPYSFVADWFLPIGNWLQSLDATNGLAFRVGSYVYYRSWEVNTSTTIDYGNSSYRNVGWELSGEKTVSVRRVPIAGFPSAPFPAFKNPLSTSHVASAMALLLQLKR